MYNIYIGYIYMDLEEILSRNQIMQTDKELIRLIAKQVSCEVLDPIINRNNIDFDDKKRLKELCELKTISGYLLQCLIEKLKKYKGNNQQLFQKLSEVQPEITIGTYTPGSTFIPVRSGNPTSFTPFNQVSPTSSFTPFNQVSQVSPIGIMTPNGIVPIINR